MEPVKGGAIYGRHRAGVTLSAILLGVKIRLSRPNDTSGLKTRPILGQRQFALPIDGSSAVTLRAVPFGQQWWYGPFTFEAVDLVQIDGLLV